LLGGFGPRAGGTSGVHISQGEAVAGVGWGCGCASGMVALGGIKVGWEAVVTTINHLAIIASSYWLMHSNSVSGCTMNCCQSLRLSSMQSRVWMKWSVDTVIDRMLIGSMIGIVVSVLGVIIIINGIVIGGVADAVLVSVSSTLAGEVVVHCVSLRSILQQIAARATESWWLWCSAIVSSSSIGIIIAVIVVVVGRAVCCCIICEKRFVMSLAN